MPRQVGYPCRIAGIRALERNPKLINSTTETLEERTERETNFTARTHSQEHSASPNKLATRDRWSKL